MVEESLVHYISNDTGLEIEQLRLVFSSTDDQPFDQEADRALIIKSISNLKIIDPACGSGAFPMGALQKMVHALAKLDPGNTLWRKSQKERLMQKTFEAFESTDLENLKKEVDAIFDNQLNDPDYARKLYLIENCLYGVDIQPIAMQISKLRFFISLLVEQHIDRAHKNFGIIALPNLETKFVAANTLIKLDKPISKQHGVVGTMFIQNPKIPELKQELESVRHKYFTARTSKTKSNHRQRDKAIRKEISELLINDGWSNEGAAKITQWDPFNPNSQSGWFDCEWMFGIKHFDIVIGNPPYIQLQKALPGHKDMKYADVYESLNYQTFKGRGDIYALFYEKGLDILSSNGILCFITSNSWMKASYGKPLRKLFIQKRPKILMELGPGVFDSAVVDVNIILIENSKVETHELFALNLESRTDIANLNYNNFITLNDLSIDGWLVLPQNAYNLKKKIDASSISLIDHSVQIKYGIKTGFNEAYIISETVKDELISKDKRNISIIKPLLRGRDISRYNFNWANKWIILVHKGLGENLETTFPSIYEYLSQFESRLKSRGQVRSNGHHWLELDNNPTLEYFDFFKNEKIIWGEISDKSKFCFDDEGFYMEATGFIMSGKNLKYLSAYMNSMLAEWYFNLIGTTTGMGTNRWKKYKIENLPLFFPDLRIEEKINSLVDALKERNENDIPTLDIEQQIDLMVYKLYDLTYDEVLIVDTETPITKEDYEAFKL